MPRILLSLLLALCWALPALAQGASNTLALYGGRDLTARQQAANDLFIQEAVREYRGREQAVDALMARGWELLRKGDPATAVKRFNQVWLLTPENPGAFWGLGAAVSEQGRHDESIALFEKAQAKLAREPALLSDFAYALIWKGADGSKSQAEQQAAYARAEKLLDEFEALKPDAAPLHANRALLLYLRGRFEDSWQSVARAQALDPASVGEAFLRRLSAKMPRPKGL